MGNKLDDKTLDAIGKLLVKADVARVPQIDEVISDPRLFARVRALIATGETMGVEPETGPSWHELIRPRSLVFGGIAALLVLAVGAFSLLETGRGVVVVEQIQIPPAKAEVARPVFPPKEIETGKLSAGRAKKPVFTAVRAVSTVRRVNKRPTVRFDAEGEFLPVALTGDPTETAGGGRIIRVDLKRSSLFALGVNLPLENSEEIVKADLLIGSDGVTRAVRVVN